MAKKSNKYDNLIEKFVKGETKAKASVSAKNNDEVLKYVKAHPQTDAKILAQELGLTVAKIAGIRRSITCQKAKTPKVVKVVKKAVKEVATTVKKAVKAPKAKSQKGTSYKLFTNYYGEGKLNAREFICRMIKLSGLHIGSILCLPAAYCLLEIKIRKEISKSFYFLACERNKSVFEQMVKSANEANLPMFFRPGDLSDAIYASTNDNYSHIILDYCGCLTTFKKEIEYIVKNNIVKVGGTIITTVLKARDEEIIKSTGIKSAPKGTSKTELAVKKFFTGIKGYELMGTFLYNDSSPMMVVAIKRTK